MAYVKGGVSGAKLEVDAATLAGRLQHRPPDVGALGYYQVSVDTGTMAAGLAAAAEVFQFRWGDATRTCVLRRIALLATHVATAFTAGAFTFDAIKSTAFSVNGTGGAALVPFGAAKTGALRTSFGATLVTDLRIATTAALTAGTKTLDSAPFAKAKGWIPPTGINYLIFPAMSGLLTAAPVATGSASHGAAPADIFKADFESKWPLTFVQNEGFSIRATVPATGTWALTVELEWAEFLNTAGFN